MQAYLIFFVIILQIWIICCIFAVDLVGRMWSALGNWLSVDPLAGDCISNAYRKFFIMQMTKEVFLVVLLKDMVEL